MGSLTLPSSGLVYLDTQAILYSVETHPRYWPLLEPLWQSVQARTFELVTSELALMRTLIAPLRHGDKVLEAAYDELFHSSELRLLPITQAVLREGARLRAALPSLRTPDALHAATSQLHGCIQFISNDLGYRQVPALPLIILDDLLKS